MKEKLTQIHNPLITLTTDFGLADEYVGVMKGVIYSIYPTVTLVDLTHAIRPQDIRQAALLIASSFHYFPARTIHLVVVDPGVGSNRRIVLLEGKGHFFLVPDNGVASFLLPFVHTAYEVNQSNLFLEPVSHTFHGRDIFAPVAAHLAAGLAAHQTGTKISVGSLKSFKTTIPTIDDSSIAGMVIDIDHFGNIITNIDKIALNRLCENNGKDNLHITIAGQTITGIHQTYADVPSGSSVALIGSRNFLEIGMNQGNFAKKYMVPLDSVVYLRKKWYA